MARLHAADVLSHWGVPSDTVETVKLVVSELTTNAVRHPGDEDAQASLFSERSTVQAFEISLEIIGDVVRVSVWDRDTQPPVLKEVGVEATGGRGVFIVALMSRCWGHYPARSMLGKVVWAEIPLVSAGQSSGGDGSTTPQRNSHSPRPRGAAERAGPELMGRVLVGMRGL